MALFVGVAENSTWQYANVRQKALITHSVLVIFPSLSTSAIISRDSQIWWNKASVILYLGLSIFHPLMQHILSFAQRKSLQVRQPSLFRSEEENSNTYIASLSDLCVYLQLLLLQSMVYRRGEYSSNLIHDNVYLAQQHFLFSLKAINIRKDILLLSLWLPWLQSIQLKCRVR